MAFHVESCLALCSRVLFFSAVTSLGEERELGNVLLMHLVFFFFFFFFACVNLLAFSLSLGVRGWLQLMIMALPGRFY